MGGGLGSLAGGVCGHKKSRQGSLARGLLLCDISRMKSCDVTFVPGMTALHGARRCRMLRLVEGAPSVLLCSLETEGECLVLGDVRRSFPSVPCTLSAQEREALGLDAQAQDEDVLFFCRVSVPADDPLSAGFDLSRLVLVAPPTGRGLEVQRSGQNLEPLAGKRRGRAERKDDSA